MQDIIIGCDHRGLALKNQVKEYLREKKLFFIDVGCADGTQSADYPLIAKEVVDCVAGSRHMCGILICGSGIGVSIAANKYKGIRAALCNSVEVARGARQHNDCNILCLAADGANIEDIKKIINTFTTTKFLNEEKYKRRINMLDKATPNTAEPSLDK